MGSKRRAKGGGVVSDGVEAEEDTVCASVRLFAWRLAGQGSANGEGRSCQAGGQVDGLDGRMAAQAGGQVGGRTIGQAGGRANRLIDKSTCGVRVQASEQGKVNLVRFVSLYLILMCMTHSCVVGVRVREFVSAAWRRVR